MYFYHLAGLSVQSEIALPGAIVDARPDGGADVTIRFGAVPSSIENATAAGVTWAMDAERFLLRVPDIARFLVTGGRAIEIALEGAATIEDATAFVAGTVLGILLHQRGHVLLHASAVSVDGEAVLFCGPSGAGKSTLAAALARRGRPFVTDDFCAIGFDDRGRPIVHPDGRSLKLWAQAIDKLELGENRGATVRERVQKFYVEPQGAALAAMRLRAVYMLREARREKRIEIARPNVVDAATDLRQNAYRSQLIRRMGQEALYFRAATTILASAGVFILERPLDFSLLPEVLDRLETHWRETARAEPRG